MKIRSAFPALLLLALSAAASPIGADERQADSRHTAGEACPADDRVAGIAGLRAFVDPQTGQLREPGPEEAQALSAGARLELLREFDSLEAVVHPDGMISLDLKGLFMQNVVIRRAPDGSLTMGCIEGPTPAAVPLDLAPAGPAPVLEEK